MIPAEVLSALRSLGLQVFIVPAGGLKAVGIVKAVTPELSQEIKQNKAGIIALLRQEAYLRFLPFE